jgi:hypothetical protein
MMSERSDERVSRANRSGVTSPTHTVNEFVSSVS